MATCSCGFTHACWLTPSMEHNVDGDELNGYFIHEMDSVNEAFMKIHPMMTMFSNTRPGINNHVSVTGQTLMAVQNWLHAKPKGTT